MIPVLDKIGGTGRDPRREGAEAHVAGFACTHCPYRRPSEAEPWRAGWDEEDRRTAPR